MAGIYGFFSRRPRPAGELRHRLAAMGSFMSSRAGHRSVSLVRESAAIGATGPAIFDGTVMVHEAPDCRALVADGEAYHLTDSGGRPAVGAAAWPVVQRKLAEHGARGLSSVDGVYACAQLTSGPSPSLTLFSDRYGSRRLYYAECDGWFLFASELAPLAGCLGSDADIDWAFVQDSLSFGSSIGDATWIQQVRLFPPATVATVTRDAVTFDRYWSWSDVPQPGEHASDDRFDRLHELWRRSIAARTNGGRVGLQLSGGLDSRLILAEARERRSDLTTTTYGEDGADDVRFARQTAAAAGVPWLFWPLPGPDWLERRVAHSVEHDGIVDVVNAHHAGLVEVIGEVMDVELSGYLGDVVMGATGVGRPADWAFDFLPYLQSPVAAPVDAARERIATEVAAAPSAHAWTLENKWRRATNAWPHLAVNSLEVRKPFMDYALVDFCAGLPLPDRCSAPQRELLRRFHPELVRVPWQKTGVAPHRGALAVAGMRGVRVAYRTAGSVASRLGRPIAPWIRTGCDTAAWCADPSIRDTVANALSDPSSPLRGPFSDEAMAETLTLAFDHHAVAVEVPLNLYRADRVVRRLRSIAAEGAIRG